MTRLNTKSLFWWCIVAVLLVALFFITASHDFTSEHTKIMIQKLTGLNEYDAYRANTLARKAMHVAIFGLLGLLFYQVLRQRSILYACMLTAVFAILDEWHQSLVPDRTASLKDVLLDTSAAFVFVGIRFWIKKSGSAKQNHV